MREYAKVAPSFWTGATGRELRKAGPECLVVAAYLMTGPGANMSGLYRLTLPALAHDIEAPSKPLARGIEGASKALRRVCESGFALYDEVEELVFVPRMAAWQVGEELKPKDKRIAGLLRLVLAHRKHIYFKQFVDIYRAPFALESASNWPEAEKALRSPFEAPSKPGAGAGAVKAKDLPAPDGASPGKPGPSRFPEFWSTWGKGPKKDAEAAYREARRRKDTPDDDELLVILKRQVGERAKAAAAGEFLARLPDLHRWFKKARWTDEPWHPGLEGAPAPGAPARGPRVFSVCKCGASGEFEQHGVCPKCVAGGVDVLGELGLNGVGR